MQHQTWKNVIFSLDIEFNEKNLIHKKMYLKKILIKCNSKKRNFIDESVDTDIEQ